MRNHCWSRSWIRVLLPYTLHCDSSFFCSFLFLHFFLCFQRFFSGVSSLLSCLPGTTARLLTHSVLLHRFLEKSRLESKIIVERNVTRMNRGLVAVCNFVRKASHFQPRLYFSSSFSTIHFTSSCVFPLVRIFTRYTNWPSASAVLRFTRSISPGVSNAPQILIS